MNQLEGLLILIALPLSLMLTGYWLAALLSDSSAVDRLAFALACGLALLLAAVAAVNFFQPLRGVWAYGCLAPILFTFLLPRTRRSLWQDLRSICRPFPRAAVGAGAVFFVLLLWPVIQAPASLFYDGTSNHDSFFWVAGAEHLKRNSYMMQPVMSATQPLTNTTSVLIGLTPPWGRIGGEALLALASSVINVSPLKLYLYATASLAMVWFGLVWLALRTFVTATPARLTGIAIVCVQPVFIFFHGNANLPNLLGTLTGSALIIAVERAIRAASVSTPAFTAWATLAALSLHGLLCSYPEMVPFVLLPCALLWLRPWFRQSFGHYWRFGLLLTAALLAGALLNPATTVRAIQGFLASFNLARENENWANLFNPLELAEYVPAFFTLSIPGSKELGWWFGWPLSALMLGLVGVAVRRSSDPFGLCAALAGSLVLLGYTLGTGFAYGMQKTVQFSGIFVVLLFPVAVVELLARRRATTSGRAHRLTTATLAVVGGFMVYANFMNCRDTYKWSDRKVISADWFDLREQSRGALMDAPVLVEAASFRMAFFHGMWAAYFLPESHLYFGARGQESGGYLRDWVVNEQKLPIPIPSAVLVGRLWGDTFDANSPKILTGREFVLLQKSNRMFAMEGVQPLNGPPDHFSDTAAFDLLPHSPSILLVELAPRKNTIAPSGAWQLTRRTDGQADFQAELSTPPPWRIRIPLVAGQRNRIEFHFAHAGGPLGPTAFQVQSLRVENAP
ncbi:hypothetical protein ESB00_16070 [Oleiharenicola lentus]|uniref:Glycosyltransferase RgtA/B/C/D-like domain-containing protein n=1 Tax=Oleiharenicola lentus TaxID=2508720 RepID=A0A4Q1C4J4_9BACT|nr:hypothetical protein [Oleiharenicola lentus]RXK53213.1 hypothetical protein ESB00_16070 [Oleiharenicola lentus]